MMLLLTSTTDKIQLVTATTGADVDVVTCYVDISNNVSPGVVQGTMGRGLATITTNTTTDIVAVPGANTNRNVKTIHVRNTSATTATDVLIQYNANGTIYELFKCNLATGEACEYVDGVGFYKIPTTPKLDKVYRVTSDYSNSTTSFTAITGLAAPVESGKFYMIEAYIIRLTAATTTGSQFAIGNVAMTSMVLSEFASNLASTTASTSVSGTATAVDTAIVAEATGPAGNVLAVIGGMINPSASGTVQLKGASEVAASAITVKAGSFMRIREFDN